jgi:transcriptional regulator GlxA family with amidase domain
MPMKRISIYLTLCMGLCLSWSVPAWGKGYTRNVAIVLYDGVELLDFAGPGEVFAAAAGFGSAGAPDGARAFNVFTVGRTREPIISQGFVKVTPDHSIADSPPIDIIVFPGGGSDAVTRDPVMMRWVRERTRTAELSMSVCTGAMILARAGMLDGRDATTFYMAIDALREMSPKTRVHHGRRFIDTGKVLTTAGVSAGIDGSLHVVARLLGRKVADETARYMEYAWHPESHLALGYSIWNPSLDERGRRVQQVRMLVDEKRWKEAEAAYGALLREKPDDGALWYQLGFMLHMAGRLDAAIPAHRRASEFPAVRANALYNLGCAYALKKQTARALTALEGAVAAGFKDRNALLGDTDLKSLQGNPRLKRLVDSIKTR